MSDTNQGLENQLFGETEQEVQALEDQLFGSNSESSSTASLDEQLFENSNDDYEDDYEDEDEDDYEDDYDNDSDEESNESSAEVPLDKVTLPSQDDQSSLDDQLFGDSGLELMSFTTTDYESSLDLIGATLAGSLSAKVKYLSADAVFFSNGRLKTLNLKVRN